MFRPTRPARESGVYDAVIEWDGASETEVWDKDGSELDADEYELYGAALGRAHRRCWDGEARC